MKINPQVSLYSTYNGYLSCSQCRWNQCDLLYIRHIEKLINELNPALTMPSQLLAQTFRIIIY